jgi:hypothetical protein
MTLPRALLPLLCLAGLALLPACSEHFSLSDLGAPPPPTSFGDTSYVLQQPAWTGFSRPADVLVGIEPFVYVADAGNNRIVMLDLSGTAVGASAALRNPVALAQDYRLQLLVCGEFDPTIGGQAATFGAIYRIDLPAAGHDIARAPLRRVYFDPLNPLRRFTGVAVLADNSYYVTRTGPNNASIIDPDDAIMLFGKDDAPQPRVTWPAVSVDGTGLATVTQPTGVAVLPKRSTDVLFTQAGGKSLFRAQWLTLRTTGDVSQWESWFTPERDGAVDFLRVGLFHRPEDVTVDAAGNVYVVDAAKDSVFRFNPSGFIDQAFGGAALFRGPSGVAHFDRTLYIADTGNDRVLRFMLSTDVK